MRRLLFGAIGAFLLVSLTVPLSLAMQTDATPSGSATPSAEPGFSVVLPAEGQVPNGLVMISDGTRTLDDVISGFADPEAAREHFIAWGWQGNVVRAFHLPPDTNADPSDIDGIYISVHAFGSPEFAAEALDYTFAAHIADTTLKEVGLQAFGAHSRALYGKEPYGNEVTLYVQQGTLLIRLSAASPTGEPRIEASALMRTMLQLQSATPIASA